MVTIGSTRFVQLHVPKVNPVLLLSIPAAPDMRGGQLLLANKRFYSKRAGIAYTELSSLEGMRDAIQATNTLEAENEGVYGRRAIFTKL